jgi:hypothetical protein
MCLFYTLIIACFLHTLLYTTKITQCHFLVQNDWLQKHNFLLGRYAILQLLELGVSRVSKLETKPSILSIPTNGKISSILEPHCFSPSPK